MMPRPTTPISIAALVATVIAGGFAASAHADISVIDNHKTLEVDCAKDPEVSLIGNHLTVTARGVCTKITISGNHETVTGSASVVYIAGNHNTITLVAADDVTIAGNSNTLTVQKSVKLKAPRVANSGTDNHITQPK
jgi:hypothetical protein